MKILKRGDLLDYEVSSSWIAGAVSSTWLQELLARYFASKIRRKYRRYIYTKNFQKHMQELRENL